MKSAADPRPLYTVLQNLRAEKPWLVLMRGGEYRRIEEMVRRAQKDARSENKTDREAVTRPDYWWTEDPIGRVVVMRRTEGGQEPVLIEPGSQVRIPEEEGGFELGRAACPGLVFSRICYVQGNHYSFDELTPQARKDAKELREEYEYVHGREPEELTWRFSVLPHDRLLEALDHEFGDRLKKHLAAPETKRVARSIAAQGGLKSPVVDGDWAAALAVATLGMEMPYFAAVPPFETPSPTFIPSLEGRR